MSRRELVAPDLAAAFAALEAELDAPGDFPPAALAEAEVAAERPVDGAPVDIPFVTIDPPGSRDLDQAIHIERRGDRYRVHYAIADLARFVVPGGALDAAVWERGVTLYAPDGSIPLHPPVLSEGAASLLPGVDRPAVLWTLDLGADGTLEQTDVRRATVRSVAQHTYADVPAVLAPLLAEVGERRAALEVARGGVSLPLPEQEVERDGDGWTVHYRAPVAAEDFNAQISLLTGMAAAALMTGHGSATGPSPTRGTGDAPGPTAPPPAGTRQERAPIGLLRTVPPADPRALERLRHVASALGVAWIDPYPAFIRSLDPGTPAGAAILYEATAVMRGAGYVAFDGELPAQPRHSALAAEYAHVTAPLRRLADRYATECALSACAGTPVPEWVRSRLAALPDAMRAADRRASALDRGAVDIVEAALLSGRVGETFDAVAIDDDVVQLTDPAVRAKCSGTLVPGAAVSVTLVEADIAARRVRFATRG